MESFISSKEKDALKGKLLLFLSYCLFFIRVNQKLRLQLVLLLTLCDVIENGYL